LISNLALPVPIDRLVDAVNTGDTDAFLALFTDDGVVDDWGRRFEGVGAIRAWSDKEFIGAKGRLIVTDVLGEKGVVTLEADWRSNFYSGASRFVFALDGDRVREMTIPAR
jgi:hypothetical protein